MASAGSSAKKRTKSESYSQYNSKTQLAELTIPGPDETVRLYPKSGASDWIGRLPQDPQPILYFSSVAGSKDWNEKKFVRLTKIKHRCFSYAYCGFDSPLIHNRHVQAEQQCQDKGDHIFLDSGAHTFHKMISKKKGATMSKGISQEDRVKFVRSRIYPFADNYAAYVRWALSEGHRYDFYVTLDAERDCKLVWDVTKYLIKKQGLFPVPVYHGDDSLDWVKRYIDEGHKIIGVGMSRRGKPTKKDVAHYYDSVTNLCDKYGVATHGFAITGDAMFRHSWYSVDSTTYIKAAAYGKMLLIIPEKQRVCQVHVSNQYQPSNPAGIADNLTRPAYNYLRNYVERLGFDFDMVRGDLNSRIMFNAKVLAQAVQLNARKQLTFRTWERF